MNEVPKEALNWEERDQDPIAEVGVNGCQALDISGDSLSDSSPTFGEKLVGKAKKLFAEAADLLHDEFYAISPIQVSELHKTLYEHSIGEILNAQMNVVKVLTLKY